jgi:cytochrome c-type biogenesis protein CcmH/NrfG
MPELAVVTAILVALAAVLVVPPLRRRSARSASAGELEGAELRHRIAIEALRDVEADHRAGALDENAYRFELAAAEAHAAGTRAALDEARADAQDGRGETTPADARSRRAAIAIAAGIGLVVVIGAVVPPPLGFASRPIANEAVLAARAAEAARQDRIAALLRELEADPRDVAALSDLADAYLAGDSADDLARAATALLVIISLEPQNEDAHRRIVTAYIRAGDLANARAALDSYAALDPDPADIAFFTGLIALRSDDPRAAIAEFDRFLELAPHDDRAAMVRSLRADAEAQTPEP